MVSLEGEVDALAFESVSGAGSSSSMMHSASLGASSVTLFSKACSSSSR